jgi:D-Tyr-tRNAtyr deacylase
MLKILVLSGLILLATTGCSVALPAPRASATQSVAKATARPITVQLTPTGRLHVRQTPCKLNTQCFSKVGVGLAVAGLGHASGEQGIRYLITQVFAFHFDPGSGKYDPMNLHVQDSTGRIFRVDSEATAAAKTSWQPRTPISDVTEDLVVFALPSDATGLKLIYLPGGQIDLMIQIDLEQSGP